MKRKNDYKLFMNIVGFITSSAFNIACFIISIILIYSYTVKAFDYGKEVAMEEVSDKPSKEVTVVIPEGASPWEIAEILKENDLISNEILFVAQATLNGSKDLMKPGKYILNADMNAGKIMEALQVVQIQEDVDNIKITIPEGLTITQMAELFESKELFSAEEFLEVCNTGEFGFDFVEEIPERDKRLEGYLFPDTYFFTKNATPKEVITKMLRRFDDIYSYELRQKTEELGLSIDKVVTMASIIESEIVVSSERELCSAIIYNRLDKDMPLQMCSSILYALDKRKDRLLLDDLKFESPYNTYENKGLPVGPISNPGEASIVAVLNPAEVDYLYFVLKDDKSGEHFFTADYDDFLTAKALYNQQF